MWCDTLELAKVTVSKDDYGYEVETPTSIEVFCNKKSVGTNEFYKSTQQGFEIKYVFEVKLLDYDEETDYVVYNKKQYKVVRTYEVDSENIELHCTLKEGKV